MLNYDANLRYMRLMWQTDLTLSINHMWFYRNKFSYTTFLSSLRENCNSSFNCHMWYDKRGEGYIPPKTDLLDVTISRWLAKTSGMEGMRRKQTMPVSTTIAAKRVQGTIVGAPNDYLHRKTIKGTCKSRCKSKHRSYNKTIWAERRKKLIFVKKTTSQKNRIDVKKILRFTAWRMTSNSLPLSRLTHCPCPLLTQLIDLTHQPPPSYELTTKPDTQSDREKPRERERIGG